MYLAQNLKIVYKYIFNEHISSLTIKRNSDNAFEQCLNGYLMLILLNIPLISGEAISPKYVGTLSDTIPQQNPEKIRPNNNIVKLFAAPEIQ